MLLGDVHITRRQSVIAINLITLALVLPFIGNLPLFDWDEINFAEIAREMVLSNNYLQVQVDWQPFWEKPPFFFWLQAGSMHIFGINEFAARLPNTLAALMTVNFLFFAGERLKHWRFGAIWATAYMGSILPSFYFKSGLIDPWFNLFMFSSIFFLFYGLSREHSRAKWNCILAAGFLSGLSVLTKGPVGWLIVGTSGLLLLFMYKRSFYCWQMVLSAIILSIGTTFLWFGIDLIDNGAWFISTFITYQIRLFSTEDAGHGGFLGYHVVILLLGCFPSSFLAIKYLFGKHVKKQSFTLLSVLSVWFIVILFSIVQSKIIHYSSYAYFPITFLAAQYMHQHKRISYTMKVTMIGFLTIITIILWTCVLHIHSILDYIATHSDSIEMIATLSHQVELSPVVWAPLVWLIIVLIILLKYWKSFSMIFVFFSVAIFVQLSIYAFTRPVYEIAYQPAIEIYREISASDAYITTYGFKTYADKFYADKMSDQVLPKNTDILKNTFDKDVYIIAKIDDKNFLLQYKGLKLLKEDRQFLLFIKKAQSLEQK